MLDDMKDALDRLRESATSIPEPRIVPAMREALAPVVDRVREDQIEAREQGREANLARFVPIWEQSMEGIVLNEAIEREAAREGERAADPSSFTALLNRNKRK